MFKVQSPEKDVFSSADLQWTYDIAYIPTNRLHQFLAGEELGSGTAPTKFKIMSSRTRKEGSLQVHRIRPECWLKYTRYWCTYGPKDHRNMAGQDKAPPDSSQCGLAESTGSQGGGTGTRAANNIRRQSASTRGEDFARGCTCHFNVKVMYLWPNITQINYVHKSHTDASGSICHGSLDPSAVGSKAQFAPRLSTEMRRWVLYLLSRNIPPKQILHEHQLLIKDKRSRTQEYTPVRDDFLNKHDILNISKRLAEETFQLHASEDESICIWAENHQEYVLYHQYEDKAANIPFILGIQTPWQKDKLLTLGHQRVVGLSTTLGTSRFKYYMFTLLVFDMHQNAIPGAWIVTSSNKACDLEVWLSRFNLNMNEYLHGWRPSCFIVDNSGAEIDAIRSVFDAPVYLCLWRVRRRWLKHLNRRVQNIHVRSAMFRKLGEIMYLSSEQSLSLCNTETRALKKVDSFLEDFNTENAFGSYFRERWLPKMGLWIKATQNMPHTNLDINSAVEGYHTNLKARLQGSRTSLSRRIDWLLHTLVKDVESHFWFIDFSKRWGFWHSTTQQLIIESSLMKAAIIPDSNVNLAISPHGPVHGGHGSGTTSTIIDNKDSGLLYTVYNSDSEWSFCDCEWSQEGNMCKHQVKILIMKGTIGGVPAQECGSSNQLGAGMRHASILDCNQMLSNLGGQGERMTPASHISSTPSEFDSGLGNELDDGFDDDDEMIERLKDHDDNLPGFAKFERSLEILINSVSDIDNVILANYAAGIMTSAARKISKLKELAPEPLRDMSFHPHNFEDGFRIQKGSNEMKTSRPIVEQVLSRKRKGRAAGIIGAEMQSLMVTEPRSPWFSASPLLLDTDPIILNGIKL